jgi:hypothetical protein
VLIYLDTKDLIDVIEGSSPVSAPELGTWLESNHSKLALSFVLVAELSAPLVSRNAQAHVMRLLAELERLPHVFVAVVQIQRLELLEALSSFREGRGYSAIDPFVHRFDHTIPPSGRPPTYAFLSYSVSETIWDIWCHTPEILDGYARPRRLFADLLRKDRETQNPPPLPEQFGEVVRRNLDLYGISLPSGVDLVSLGKWIYSSTERCPSGRLTFEVWHRLRQNRRDKTKHSDLSDFNHLACLPYVDVATLDRRMLSYVESATRGWDPRPMARCFHRVEEALAWVHDLDSAEV